MENEKNTIEMEEEEKDTRNAKERLYDKIPLTYRQVDLLTKGLIVLVIVLIVIFTIIS